jgi:hypothetical protein
MLQLIAKRPQIEAGKNGVLCRIKCFYYSILFKNDSCKYCKNAFMENFPNNFPTKSTSIELCIGIF